MAQLVLWAQYTETINSNKPGESMGAFSIGQHVFQVEVGNRFEYMKHNSFNDSKVIGYAIDISARYGFFRDELELVWDFSYQFDQLQSRVGFPVNINRNGLYRNSIGAKYLFYDPYKRSPKQIEKDEKKIDIRSWNANNTKFRWRDLIPAVSAYAGFNLNFSDTYAYGNYFADFQVVGLPDSSDEPVFSPRVALATQSHIRQDWVIVTNLSYNRIGTDFPELGFIATVTYNFNPKWTAFVESQTFDSDVYADQIFRGGAAYLFNKNLQFEATLGGNIKNSPSRIFGNIGVSFRIDNHTDDDTMSFERYKKKIGREAVQEEAEKRSDIKKERKKERKEKKRQRKKNKKDREERGLDEFLEDVEDNDGLDQPEDEEELEEDNRKSKVRDEFREIIEGDDDEWRKRVNDDLKEEIEYENEQEELKAIEKELRKIEKEERKEEKRRQKEEKRKQKEEKKKRKKDKKRDQEVDDDFNDN